MMGEFGQTVKPFNPEVQKKIIGDETPITCRPADLIPPQLPQFEKECAQWKQQDEDVLSYALFPKVAEEFFKYREAQQTKVDAAMADTARARHILYKLQNDHYSARRASSTMEKPVASLRARALSPIWKLGGFPRIHDRFFVSYKIRRNYELSPMRLTSPVFVIIIRTMFKLCRSLADPAASAQDMRISDTQRIHLLRREYMKKRPWKQGLAVCLGLMLGTERARRFPGAAAGSLWVYSKVRHSQCVYIECAQRRRNVLFLCGEAGPGTAVTVIGETTASDGKLWYQIRFTGAAEHLPQAMC